MNRRNFLKGVTASIASLVALRKMPDVAAQDDETFPQSAMQEGEIYPLIGQMDWEAGPPRKFNGQEWQLESYFGDGDVVHLTDDWKLDYIGPPTLPYSMYGNRETKRIFDAVLKEYFEPVTKPKITVVPRD